MYASHPRPTIVLNYAFEPLAKDGKLVMRILLEFQSRPIETANLVVPSTWGDAKDLEKGITNLKNVHDAGYIRISYDLVKDWVVPPPRADHHAILEPEYFEFNTQNGLVHPKIAATAPVEVHLDWRKLPPGWSLATSFGTGDRLQSFSGTWGEVNNALFAGGDFRIHQAYIAGRPLILAIRSKWQLTDEEVAVRILKMISFERAFWRDYNFPYYLVTVSTFGRDDGGSGGGGFTNAFALFLQRGSSFGYGVQSLLTHEIFHTWNPYRMGVLPDSSIGMSWFTEGFTTYYQDVLLLRAGLLSFPEYVQHTNENLRKYLLSPARNVTNQEVIERHRVDSASDVIPYSRGATTALWLDSTIRKATRGKSSLDTVMFDLVRQARGRKPVLTAERVFRTARKYIDAAALQQLREAFQAGVRDGQQVTRTNIYWNDVSKPVQLTVRAEGGSKAIEYYPRGPSLGLIPQYHFSADASTSADRCAQ
jgi:predicted metalloprotease with PDZ domain